MAEDRDQAVRLGFRIEFWERPDGDDPGELAGGAYIEDAYLAAALPRPGDLVSSGIIAGYRSRARVPQRWLPVPFLRVAWIEHYPGLLDVPGGMPAGGPGVQVVFRLKAPDGVVARDDLDRLLTGLGWTVEWHLGFEVPDD
jgi:hypothetical protein